MLEPRWAPAWDGKRLQQPVPRRLLGKIGGTELVEIHGSGHVRGTGKTRVGRLVKGGRDEWIDCYRSNGR
jgi:hypothetical protein